MSNDVVQFLRQKQHAIEQQIKVAERSLAKINRMLEIAEPGSSNQPNLQRGRRSRVSTVREGGRLSREQAADKAMEAFQKHRSMNRAELGRALGYASSNGTVSRVVKELLAAGAIVSAGRDSTNKERFREAG